MDKLAKGVRGTHPNAEEGLPDFPRRIGAGVQISIAS